MNELQVDQLTNKFIFAVIGLMQTAVILTLTLAFTSARQRKGVINYQSVVSPSPEAQMGSGRDLLIPEGLEGRLILFEKKLGEIDMMEDKQYFPPLDFNLTF